MATYVRSSVSLGVGVGFAVISAGCLPGFEEGPGSDSGSPDAVDGTIADSQLDGDAGEISVDRSSQGRDSSTGFRDASDDSTVSEAAPGDAGADSGAPEGAAADALAVPEGAAADALAVPEGAAADALAVPEGAAADALGTSDAAGSDSAPDTGPPPSGSLGWARQLRLNGSWDGREALVLDTNSIVVAASFVGTANVGGGDLASAGLNDVLIARLAKADGAHIASTRYGGAGSEFPFAMAIAPDGTVFVQGIFNNGNANLGGTDFTWGGTGNNAFLAEYGTGLTHKWSRGIVSADDDQAGHAVSFDTSGNVYTTGKFRLTTDFGGGSITCNGDSDAFYARYDEGNNLNAFVRFGSPSVGGYESGEAAVFSSGLAVVGGEFNTTINLNGGSDIASAGGLDLFVAAFSTAGTRQWLFTVAGPGDDSDVRLATDAAGHVYVAGTFQQTVTIGGKTLISMGGSDVFLARLAPTGTVDWARSFGGTGPDIAWKLASSPSGDLAITGDFSASVDFGGGVRTSAGGRDLFIAAYNGADGSYRWDHSYGGTGDDFGQSVDVAADGSVYAIATFSTPVDFGRGVLNPGSGDSVVLHFIK